MLKKIVNKLRRISSFTPPQKEQLSMRLDLQNFKDNSHNNLPQNYSFSTYQSGDEDKWLMLLNKSNDFGVWNLQRLHSEILQSLVNNGGIFVINNNELIGCTSICKIENYASAAVLMYVFVSQEHRGKKIGKCMISKALIIAKEQNFPEIVLKTDDFRRSAIKEYFELGFLPNLETSADAQKRWNSITLEEYGINLKKYLIEKANKQ